MNRNRMTLAVALLLTAALTTLAGCAPRAGAGEIMAAGGEGIVLDLPALVIAYDADGQPSIAGVSVTELANSFSPGAADALVQSPETIQMLTDANIQHIQINNRLDGPNLLVNGRALPTVVWDGASLQAAGETLGQLGIGGPALAKILPVIANLGMGVTVTFPVADGAEAIPLAENMDAATAGEDAQAAFLDAVETPPTIQIPVYYDADGMWTVADMTEAEWSALTGAPMDALNLPADLIQGAVDAGISTATVSTDAEGIHVALNGQELPYISWEEGKLANVITLAVESGLLNMDDAGMSADDLTALIQTLLPAVQSSNVSINVYFPGS